MLTFIKMKKKYEYEIEIPEGINCEFAEGNLVCKKGNTELKKDIAVPGTKMHLKDSKIVFTCNKANKKDIAIIKANAAHIKNMFGGLQEKFVYEMEICNVHFPMNVRVQDKELVISNFLGEKINRMAKIIEGADVEIKGNKIIVSSADVEKAGQTAANIEKASKVPKKDRRIFQDGIFITSKPGRDIWNF